MYYKRVETAPELLREVSAKPPQKMLKISFGFFWRHFTVDKSVLLTVPDFAPPSNKTSSAYNTLHLSISEWSLLPILQTVKLHVLKSQFKQ